MKRPHRRSHLLIWVILAPVTAIVAVLFWTLRPDTQFTDLPPGIDVISDDTEGR